MNEKTKAVLLSARGFLRLVHDGFPASRSEADEILKQIGEVLEGTGIDLDGHRGARARPGKKALTREEWAMLTTSLGDRIEALLPPREA